MTDQIRLICDPIKGKLASIIESAATKAFPGSDPGDLQVFAALERPPEPAMGDFAMPCFRFAKPLKKKPQEIADALQNILMAEKSPLIKEIKVVGAFLNFYLDQSIVAADLLPAIMNETYFQRLRQESPNKDIRVMIEFSQPNTHKEFHVGHGRNVCLGDSVRRIFEYNGYTTIPANYIGDEGAHIAKVIWQMQQAPTQGASGNKSEWYGKRYVEACSRLDSADGETKQRYLREVSEVLRSIEAKSGPNFEVWKKSRVECLEDFKKIYAWLDVRFDHYFFESDLSVPSQVLIDEYLKKGFFQVSDGAVGKDLSDAKLGFCMVRKSDGNLNYMARDVALAAKKFDEFRIDRSIYVVATEQNLHFQQLFKVLELMGFPQAKKCYHLSYGMVTRPEGKMSSRKGNSVTFGQLKDQMLEELGQFLERYREEWSETEISDTANKLSVAAIKYGMLHADPAKDTAFDLKDWLSFEGNTGPYLMYAYARIASILRKASEQGSSPSAKHLNLLRHETERELIQYVYEFNNVVWAAGESYKPSIICNHLFAMCKGFNRFYADVPVLKADSDEAKGARLYLISAFARVLKEGLNLIGITPVDRM
jgi:arginyl-tRNA synthetase